MIELLVVMLILGILAATAVPVYLRQRASGYDATAKADVRNGVVAQETYYVNSSPNAYTDNSTAHGLLPGWNKSATTAAVRFSFNAESFRVDGESRTGTHFCFDRADAGAGVINNGTTPCF